MDGVGDVLLELSEWVFVVAVVSTVGIVVGDLGGFLALVGFGRIVVVSSVGGDRIPIRGVECRCVAR